MYCWKTFIWLVDTAHDYQLNVFVQRETGLLTRKFQHHYNVKAFLKLKNPVNK